MLPPDAISDMQLAALDRPTHRGWVNRGAGVKISIIALLAGATLAYAGIVSRDRTFAQLRQKAQERGVPIVSVSAPTEGNAKVTLQLPGRLEAYARAALFARVTGFVVSWTSDIGATVKAGDVLAEIEAPDLDQQLVQAQSDLANAQAAEQLSALTNQRFQALVPNHTVSRQTADEKAGDLAVKRAQVRSARANMARLEALAQYKHVVAPFDGTVTARNTDVGALINAGSTVGSELFVVSDTRKLRLYVNVPQNYVPAIKAGLVARITVPERSSKSYTAQVEAGSGAVDTATGTMRTLIVVDNAQRELTPGGFATVQLEISGGPDVLSVPASAVIFDKSGLRVATVDADDTIVFKKIAVARDLGNRIEIASGLSVDDRIVQNPPDDLIDGDHVSIVAERTTPPPASARLQKPNDKS